ncbi:LysR family transcriptional regulator [Jatrophihabitans fulvus]
MQQLVTFVAVSRHGSVARAAEAMGMTASPVSRTLGQLERALGPLFDREYHRLGLTAAGERLLPTAVAIVRAADDLDAIARGESVPLRYAATPWVPARFARALGEAAARVGPCRDVDAAVSSTLLHRMRHGEIDVAVVHLPVEGDELGSVALARYRLHLAMAPDDPLAGGATVRGEDLRGRRVLLLPSSMHPSMARLRDWFEQRGVASVDEVDLGDVVSMPARLRRERAVTVVAPDPESPILHTAEVRTVPLDGDAGRMTLGVAWRRWDAARAQRLARIVEELRPADGDLATIGE